MLYLLSETELSYSFWRPRIGFRAQKISLVNQNKSVILKFLWINYNFGMINYLNNGLTKVPSGSMNIWWSVFVTEDYWLNCSFDWNDKLVQEYEKKDGEASWFKTGPWPCTVHQGWTWPEPHFTKSSDLLFLLHYAFHLILSILPSFLSSPCTSNFQPRFLRENLNFTLQNVLETNKSW